MRVSGKIKKERKGLLREMCKNVLKIGSLSVSGGSWGTGEGLFRSCGALHRPKVPIGTPFDTPGAPKFPPWGTFWDPFRRIYGFIF